MIPSHVFVRIPRGYGHYAAKKDSLIPPDDRHHYPVHGEKRGSVRVCSSGSCRCAACGLEMHSLPDRRGRYIVLPFSDSPVVPTCKEFASSVK